MRKFFVFVEEECETCKGCGAVDNMDYINARNDAMENRLQVSTVALEEIYGKEVLPCPNECRLGRVMNPIPLTEALKELAVEYAD